MAITKSNHEQSRLVSEESGKIKVLFVDDHQLVREIVTDYLENAGQYVIDQADSVSEAINRIEGAERPYDVVLLDYALPDSVGLPTLKQLLAMTPDSKFAMITGSAGEGVGLAQFAQSALSAGATGFLTKNLSPEALIKAVEAIRHGLQYIPVEIMYESKTQNSCEINITQREYDVLCLVAKGLQNKHIAYDLGLSEPTIKMHVTSLFTKVGATNRTELTQLAKRAAII
jgi:DNA-binding NarL/FixJ family response regulator